MPISYGSYIRSRRWLASPARLCELKLAGHRCRICNRSRRHARLEVHHRTYVRLGRERVADLTTLCEPCHIEVTEFLTLRRRRAPKAIARDIPRLVDSQLV